MKNLKSRLIRFALLTPPLLVLIFLYSNCSGTPDFSKSQEVITGNPDTEGIAVSLSGVVSQAVKNLKLCPRKLRLVPAQQGQATVEIPILDQSLMLADTLVPLIQAQIPIQTYARAELILGGGTSCLSTLEFSNLNGAFATESLLVTSLVGTLTLSKSTQALNLNLQPLIDNLAAVSANSEVDSLVSGTDGQIEQIDSPAYLQLQTGTVSSNVISVSTSTFNQPVKQGNLLVCAVSFNSPTASVVSISDSNGSGFNRAFPNRGQGLLSNWILETWVSASARTGPSPVVTANFDFAFSGEKNIICVEYAGLYSPSPVQVDSWGGIMFGANASTPLLPIDQDNELLFAVALLAQPGTSGPGYTQRVIFKNMVVEDKVVGPRGSYDATFLNSPTDWILHLLLMRGF